MRRLHYWTRKLFTPDRHLRRQYEAFRELLRHDRRSLELVSELEEIGYGGTMADWSAVGRLVSALDWSVGGLVRALSSMRPGRYGALERRCAELAAALQAALPVFAADTGPPYRLDIAEAAGRPDLAGGKAVGLARALAAGFPQPAGFVITTRACTLFLSENSLRHRLDELLAEIRLPGVPARLEEISCEIIQLIEEAEIPAPVLAAIEAGLAGLPPGPLVLRSSAVAEDGEKSFAGQYRSVLDVPWEDVPRVYREIIASKYSPEALAYRVRCGLADQETPMAVLVMEMIEARGGGVIYTREQTAADDAGSLAVYRVSGAGGKLMDGSTEAEVWRFSREAGATLAEDGSVASLLARWGLTLEELFGGPQDIEWCEDSRGRCYLLQCRPLHHTLLQAGGGSAGEGGLPELPILTAGGDTVSAGVGCGRVFLLENESQLAKVPDGAVLVAASLPPSFTAILERLRAVVAEGGSRASHFASIAREYGLPVIAGLPGAKRLLPSGEVVTVDASRREIYRGGSGGPGGRKKFPPAEVFAGRFDRLLQLVSPLHLLDPAGPGFAVENCRSMHDLVRFAHERGMAEMFSLIGPGGREMSGGKRLEGGLPLTMHVLDLDGGLHPAASAKKVIVPADFASPLMRAAWAGLATPAVSWPEGLAVLDWQAADRLAGGIVSLDSAVFGSYAAVAREYLHLVLRFGYHFAVLDAFGSGEAEANYINFRFKGGGGSFDQRLLRVQLIEKLLSWAGFAVTIRGDMLEASFQRRPLAEILARLTVLGIVQGKCRLLDMSLTDEGQIREMAENWWAILERQIKKE